MKEAEMTGARFATFTANGQQFYGMAVDGGMIALSPDFPHWPTLRAAIAADGLPILAQAALGLDVTHMDGTFRWDIPVPDAEKIICVGVNYPDRNAEYKDGQEAPPNMSLFIRFARSFVGHQQPLIRPPESPQLDYEGEIAIVIGTGGRRIPEEIALKHIAGLTLCNEGTLRDWVRHAKFNVTQGKNWDASGAMGPWLVPFTDAAQITDMGLQTRVNGDLRQDDRTGRMLFPVARQIAYISTFTTLVPGDIIVTGTPTGAGARFDPPRWLVPCDVVTVSGEGIGTLQNGVRDA
jgi:2-keto-4-pentenoate hydratase/2-oxohepta-3-ene-1,7-dioic acid hydratase in catechol pathway